MKKHILFLFAFVLLASANTMGQDTKIAFADADSIFRALPEAKDVETRLQKYAKQWEDQLAQLQKDYQAKVTDFMKYRDSTDAADIIPKLLEDKAKAAQELEKKIQEEQRNAQMDVARKEQELINPIREKIQAGIDAVSKEMGYSFVVPSESLLYADPANDLTNAVIKKLTTK